MRLQGPVFAIVTPFTAQGRIDEPALGDYLQFLFDKGVPAIVAGGTTGEFPSLTLDERKGVLEQCRKSFPGAVIAHVSACCVQDSRELLAHARDHADGVLLLPPFYYANADPEGVLAFLRAVVGRSELPVYLYNFPEHTQFAITPGHFGALSSEFSQLAGIKDSGGDLQASRAYKAVAPQLQVFVGSDRRALEVLEIGLDGSVTGAGNPVPEFLVELARGFRAGELKLARQAQADLNRWTQFRESVPVRDLSLVKAALNARIPGFPVHVRPPFVTANDAMIARIRTGLEECLRPEVA